MADKMIPGAALDYIKNKKLKPAFSYKDVWNEEHAAAFTVAKALQIDVLSDLKGAVEKAIADGQTFDQFKKNIKPTLMSKGWWGKRDMTDPLTGETVHAQLGSDRRLKTIYRTNLRSAYQKGQYDRTMASDAHPYLMYRIGPSQHHRENHQSWDGLILPKDDPWWNTHFPPNGWGCKCYTRAVSEARKKKYESEGLPVPRTVDGAGGGRIEVKTERPKTTYRTVYNERKRFFEKIPQGITPGFSWNQGAAGRDVPLFQECIKKAQDEMPEALHDVVETLMHSKVYQDRLSGFVDEAYANKLAGRVNNKNTLPVGFLDKKITDFLEKEGVNIGERNVIVLEQKLITSNKYLGRHTQTGNAPFKTDWKNIMDYLVDAEVYWQEKQQNLLFFKKITEERYLRIAVDVKSSERYLKLPKIDTMYALEIASENDIGIDSYRNMMELKKIK